MAMEGEIMAKSGAGWGRYLDEHETEHMEALKELLRIPSVSALPAHAPDINRAAEWVAARLRSIGLPEVELLPTEGAGPAVFGRWHVADNRPTALIYAHYDVQPGDPFDLWETPPFEPVVRDGAIYARGATDDKGGLLGAVNGIEAYTRTVGGPPINLIFLFEGEEEIGSPTLPKLVAAEKDRLACDVIFSADGGMYGPDNLSLSLSSKGMAACQIDLRTAATDLHSGQYGATVPNAPRALAQLLATLHDDDNRVAVAGFYDAVRPYSAEDRAEIARTPFDERGYMADIGVTELVGERGFTPRERAGSRPTLDINGIWGGFQGDGTKTVTPCEAHAKITCRLVKNQEPVQILDLIERHVAANTPPGATVTVTRFGGSARPFEIPRDNPYLTIAADVLTEIGGKEPLYTREGGTLPIAEVFQRELGADMVFFAWGMPDCRAHAPNEVMKLEHYRAQANGYASLLEKLAEMHS
jgi:acetylornithine deacetylase/succinyl-diaminopimelate desuccinylase-like protein